MTNQTPAPTIVDPKPIPDPSARAQTGPDGHRTFDSHSSSAVEAQTSRPTIVGATPKRTASAGTTTSPQAIAPPEPLECAPAGSTAGRGHGTSDTQRWIAPATDFPGDQSTSETQARLVAGDQAQPTAVVHATPIHAAPSAASSPRAAKVHMASIAAAPLADQAGSPAPAMPAAMSRAVSLGLADPHLGFAAEVLDDLERVRISNENRLRQITRTDEDKDGEKRGFGVPVAEPAVARLAAIVGMMKCDSTVLKELGVQARPKGKGCCLEHEAEKALTATLKGHPLAPWVKATVGVGPKQGARLLAAIGDPYWNDLHGRPRTVYELYAYCGYHVLPAGHAPGDAHVGSASGGKTGHSDHFPPGSHSAGVGVAAKRARGQKANWSATAKMRAYLIAESCMKNRQSPFRPIYDEGREKYADATHATPCVRCGPKGKPASVGSPLSAGHQNARALRLVAKELLKELWREAKRIHEPPGDQTACDTQERLVAGAQTSPQATGVAAPTGHTPAGIHHRGAE